MPNVSRTDAPAEFQIRRLWGIWRERPLVGSAVLRLHDGALEILSLEGDAIREGYDALSGASFRAGCIELHASAGSLRLEADEPLERAWILLVARACPVPEFARGLRVLGSRRGGDASAQARFFAPLIQARRRLEEEADIERRLEAFSARALAEQLRQVIAALAAERYPKGGADRRALEAELLDALEELFDRFDALNASAGRFRAAREVVAFDHWRAWVSGVADVFAYADRGWSVAVRLLPPVPPAATRRGVRRRGPARVLFPLASLGAAALGTLR